MENRKTNLKCRDWAGYYHCRYCHHHHYQEQHSHHHYQNLHHHHHHHYCHNAGQCSERHNESETLPPKISRVGAAADSVVVVSVVVVVVVVVVEEGVGAAGAAMGAAMGATMVGASLEGGVTAAAAVAPVSVGIIANRSSSGAMSPLPSVVAKGSSGRAAG